MTVYLLIALWVASKDHGRFQVGLWASGGSLQRPVLLQEWGGWRRINGARVDPRAGTATAETGQLMVAADVRRVKIGRAVKNKWQKLGYSGGGFESVLKE